MMSKKLGSAAFVVLPIVAGGLAYASMLSRPQSEQATQATAETYTCPLTGEELPCRNCCPIGEQK